MEKRKPPKIQDYHSIVGEGFIRELELLAQRLSTKSVYLVNFATGDGMLNQIVLLLNQLGVDIRWKGSIKGEERFFEVIKRFEAVLQGKSVEILKDDFLIFEETTERNIDRLKLDGDVIFIPNYQPVGLVKRKKELANQWVWECQFDVSKADPKVWTFLRSFIDEYDAAVFPTPNFAQPLPIRRFIIRPSIDPLSDRNKELPDSEVKAIREEFGINTKKPIITQVSPFDSLENPFELIEVFKLLKRDIDCQLVLAGEKPRSEELLNQIKERAKACEDIHILPLGSNSDIEVNALERASTIVVQQSLKEGFGIEASEALWKAKPVVASPFGGVPLQVKPNINGILAHSVEEMAEALSYLLNNPEYARWLGKNGKEHIKQNFLITRQLRDYLLLFLSLEHPQDIVYL